MHGRAWLPIAPACEVKRSLLRLSGLYQEQLDCSCIAFVTTPPKQSPTVPEQIDAYSINILPGNQCDCQPFFVLTAARGEPTVSPSVSVDRATKGDRLRYASASKSTLNSSHGIPQAQRPPIGCDPAFSVVADPTHAHIYRRCAA